MVPPANNGLPDRSSQYAPGQRIRYSRGTPMQNFYEVVRWTAA